MKTELTSLDLHFLVRELQQIVGGKIDKIYEQEDESSGDPAEQKKQRFSEKKEFLLIFHKTGRGKLLLRIRLPSFVYLTGQKQVFPETPPGFCMFLRKHLGNARVVEIRQKGFERILEIVFDTKEGKRTLICELFSKGNMILVDESQKIKGLLESQNWQSRTIRGGTAYEYPPQQANTLELTEIEFHKILSESKKDSIVKALAVDLGLGGVYAEEICKRADITKERQNPDTDAIKRMFIELRNMLDEEGRANRSGDEIFPIVLKVKEPEENYESFNQALDANLTGKIVSSAVAKEAKEKKTKNDKINLVIEKQEERLHALEQGIIDNQRKGEVIYEHYTEIKELLDQINTDRKKMDWEALKKKYEDHNLIKEIQENKGRIIVELG